MMQLYIYLEKRINLIIFIRKMFRDYNKPTQWVEGIVRSYTRV